MRKEYTYHSKEEKRDSKAVFERRIANKPEQRNSD